jgi:hypothetical protein
MNLNGSGCVDALLIKSWSNCGSGLYLLTVIKTGLKVRIRQR